MSIVRLMRRGPASLGIGVLSMLVAHCATYQLLGGSTTAATTTASADATARLAAVHLAAGHESVAAALLEDSAGPAVHAGHAHVLPMASVAFLLAVVAGLGCLVALRRRRTVTVPGIPTLLGVQLGAFAALEAFDRLVASAGALSALSDVRVWAALAAQPVVAVIVWRLLRRAVAVVADWLAAPRNRVVGAAVLQWRPTLASVPPWLQVVNPGAPRGPPSVRSIPI